VIRTQSFVGQFGLPVPIKQEQMTNLSAAATLPSPPAGASRVMLQAESQHVRLRSDGTDPTGSVGTLVLVGASPIYAYSAAIKVIQTASGAKLNLTWLP
jgi:hypothetical protein